MSLGTPPSTARPRIDVVDWLRGAAVVLMIMAHGMDAWLLPAAKTGAIYAVIKVGSGIPARLFLFLVGVSAAIQFEAGLAKGLDSGTMRGRLAKRGLQVLALAYLFRLQEWLLSHFYGGWEALVRIDILNAIGMSMVLVALVAAPRKGRRQIGLSLALAALFLALGTVVGPAHFPAWLPRPLTSYLGGQRPMSWFPLFPWGAWAFTGVAVGHLWVLASRDARMQKRAFALTFAAGAAMTATVVIMRAIDPTVIRYPSELIMQMGPGIFFHRLASRCCVSSAVHPCSFTGCTSNSATAAWSTPCVPASAYPAPRLWSPFSPWPCWGYRWSRRATAAKLSIGCARAFVPHAWRDTTAIHQRDNLDRRS